MSARSTKASNALARLKERSGNQGYSMTITGAGHFLLSESPDSQPLNPPMELDDFVAFVNAQGPQKAKRVSKLDVAFEKQLVKKTGK
ncbi:hypothetical protein [Pseudoduganella sp. RAF53_2]|jgi:hypothetical protein|uniref:hypothetical protein n=1 Tax=unclassified Pseudoduganella TaxID=2637179 RepID=UPI003F9A4005